MFRNRPKLPLNVFACRDLQIRSVLAYCMGGQTQRPASSFCTACELSVFFLSHGSKTKPPEPNMYRLCSSCGYAAHAVDVCLLTLPTHAEHGAVRGLNVMGDGAKHCASHPPTDRVSQPGCMIPFAFARC